MRNTRWLALAVLGLGLALTTASHSQPPQPPQPQPQPAQAAAGGDLAKALAEASGVAEKDATRLLAVLGPVLSQAMAAGNPVTIPGLGSFRIVRLAETKNLVDGRPVVQPAVNVIEFLPEGVVTRTANAPGT